MSTDPDDPYLEAAIEAEVARALGPAAGALPAEILDELRMLLRLGLRHHPGARGLLEQLRPAPAVGESGKVTTAAFKERKKARKGTA